MTPSVRSSGHSLGTRSRPRRVEHQRPRLGVCARLRGGASLVEQAGKIEVRRIRNGHGDAIKALRVPRGGQCRCGNVLVNDRAGFGILDAEIDIFTRRAPVHRRDDDAGELAGPVDGRCLPAILQHGEEMIAGLETELVEGGNKR